MLSEGRFFVQSDYSGDKSAVTFCHASPSPTVADSEILSHARQLQDSVRLNIQSVSGRMPKAIKRS